MDTTKFQHYFRAFYEQLVRRLAFALKRNNIPYALLGSAASLQYGYFRGTEDIDFLVNKSDKNKTESIIDEELEKIELEDQHSSLLVDIIDSEMRAGFSSSPPSTEGLQFTDPRNISEIHNGLSVLTLPKLIEYKISSFLFGSGRGQDQTDVIRLIRANNLPEDYNQNFREQERVCYSDLWKLAQLKNESALSVRGKIGRLIPYRRVTE